VTQPFDAIVVGGGHNGLACAAFLAKGGLKPLVLERTDRVGGCARTTEIRPGFRTSTLAHRAAIDPAIVRALDLERHGLRTIHPQAIAAAPSSDGRMLTLWADTARAARDVAAFSARDAGKLPDFLKTTTAISRVLRGVSSAVPPSIESPDAGDLLRLVRTGRQFRALGRRDAYRLLRWLSTPVADMVHEWFESEPLCAMVAAAGLLGSFAGPRSAGTSASFLMLSACGGHPVAPGSAVAGGMGTLADALAAAARDVGVSIRTGADVRQILVRDGAAAGVVLSTGEEMTAPIVVSNADPRRTLEGLVDPVHLSPEFLRRVRHVRMRGSLAKVNYAVASLPAFTGLGAMNPDERRAAMSGCVRLGPSLDVIERAYDAAKYGDLAEEPWIELAVPSIGDPSLAPHGRHVLSAYVQFAPYRLKGTTWEAERARLGDVVTKAIGGYAPGFEQSVIAMDVITPSDLERVYGLTGGHIFHGELALDQLFLARPLIGWSQYATPIRNLYLCGAGTHPGTGIDGRPGHLAAKTILRRGVRAV
jgi:phytoene dehydrogenase-like protein